MPRCADAFCRLPFMFLSAGQPFSSEDYMRPTPEWARFGAPEGGFDPHQTRVRKVRRHPGKDDSSVAPSEAGGGEEDY